MEPLLPKSDNHLKGALLIAAAVSMIAANNAIAKHLGNNFHPVEIAFYRNIVVLAGLAFWMFATRQWHLTKTADVLGQFHRAAVGTMGVVCAFWALTKLPLAEATTLFYAAPLLVTVLSYPLLKERVGLFRGSAILIGFTGIVIVANPSGEGLPLAGVAIALTAALFHALTQLQLRKLGLRENPMTTVFYFMLFSSLMTGMAMPFVFTSPPDFSVAPIMLLLSLTAIAQQVLKTFGYAMAPTSVVTPINYTGLLWAAFFGFIFWGHVPHSSLYLGGSIIIAANLTIVWRERYLKKMGRI